MKKKKLKKIFYTFILSLVAYLTIINLTNSYFDLNEVIQNLDYKFFILSLICCLISKIFDSFSLYILFNAKSRFHFMYYNRVSFNAQFLNIFPFLGTFYKGITLKKDYKIRYLNFIYVLIFTIILDLLLILLILAFFFFFSAKLGFENKNFFIMTLLILFVSLIILIFLEKFKFLMKYKMKHFSFLFLKKKYFEFLKINSFYIKKKFLILKFIIFHLFSDLFFLFSFFFLFIFFSFNISFIQISFIYFLFRALTIIKLFPQNYGINEFIGGFLISKSYVGFATGYILMICFRLIDILSILFLAIFFNLKFSKKSYVKKKN